MRNQSGRSIALPLNSLVPPESVPDQEHVSDGWRWTKIFLFINLFLVALSAALGIKGYSDIHHLQRPHGGDDAIYVISQLGYEHMRLLQAVESGASSQDIRLRGDILLHRVDLLLTAPMLEAERQRMKNDAIAALDSLAKTTDLLIEDLLGQEGRNALLARLRADVVPVRNFMTDMSYVSRQLQAEDRRHHINGLIVNLSILGALLLTLMVLSAVVLRMGNRLHDVNRKIYAAAEVLKRNLDLEVEKSRSDAANLAKSQFLANVSHEIRTPLNAIIGTLQLFDKESLTSLNRDALDVARRASRSLLEIVNSILDLSKIEARETSVYMSRFSLRCFAADLLAQHAAVANEKNIDLLIRFDEGLHDTAYTDMTKLEQILNNLLSNALKFTDAGSVKLVVESPTRESDASDGRWQNAIQFRITDTGIGISDDDQKELFQPFKQVDGSLTRKHMGTGLGLSITRQLAGLLGGSVRLKSEKGVGTTVSVLIPNILDATDLGSVNQIQLRSTPLGDAAFVLIGGSYATIFRAGIMLAQLGEKFHVIYTPEQARDMMKLSMRHVRAMIVDCRFGEGAPSCLEAMACEQGVQWCTPTVLFQRPGRRGMTDADYVKAEISSVFNRSGLLKALQAAMPSDVIHKPVGSHDEPVKTTGTEFNDLTALVVDDNAINRKILQRLLTSIGLLRVSSVGSGTEAVERLLETPFDIVFMDIQMPDVDGYMATKIIRDRGFSKVRIIACSAHAFETDVARSYEAGMNGHISKPVLIEDLVKLIRQLFQI